MLDFESLPQWEHRLAAPRASAAAAAASNRIRATRVFAGGGRAQLRVEAQLEARKGRPGRVRKAPKEQIVYE